MITPRIIAGPAIVTWGGHAYYFRDGLTNSVKRETFTAEVNGAEADERMKAQYAEVTGRPASQLDDMTKYWPYGAGQIGQPLFDPDALKPLVIVPMTGEQITYPNAALTKTPEMTLRAGADEMFGEMTWTCLGDPSKEATDAAYFRTLAESVFTDTSFDEGQNFSDLYTAAWGDAPYDAMVSVDGFTLGNPLKLWEARVDNFGIVNTVLKSMTVTAKFKPANLTETQIDGLLNTQGSGAIAIGGSLGGAGRDLVISGARGSGGLTATVRSAGPKSSALEYSTGKLRQGEIVFVQRRTWTSGVADELFTLAIGS